MIVRGKIEVKFNVDNQKWEGIIYIYLPADDGERIVPELRSTKCVFGYFLHTLRGTPKTFEGEKFREIWKMYNFSSDKTLEEVLEALEGKLKEKIEIIKSIYKENLERMNQSVQKEYEFKF